MAPRRPKGFESEFEPIDIDLTKLEEPGYMAIDHSASVFGLEIGSKEDGLHETSVVLNGEKPVYNSAGKMILFLFAQDRKLEEEQAYKRARGERRRFSKTLLRKRDHRWELIRLEKLKRTISKEVAGGVFNPDTVSEKDQRMARNVARTHRVLQEALQDAGKEEDARKSREILMDALKRAMEPEKDGEPEPHFLFDKPMGWSLPGGEIEVGETLWEALQAELFEELGSMAMEFVAVYSALKSTRKGGNHRIYIVVFRHFARPAYDWMERVQALPRIQNLTRSERERFADHVRNHRSFDEGYITDELGGSDDPTAQIRSDRKKIPLAGLGGLENERGEIHLRADETATSVPPDKMYASQYYYIASALHLLPEPHRF